MFSTLARQRDEILTLTKVIGEKKVEITVKSDELAIIVEKYNKISKNSKDMTLVNVRQGMRLVSKEGQLEIKNK